MLPPSKFLKKDFLRFAHSAGKLWPTANNFAVKGRSFGQRDSNFTMDDDLDMDDFIQRELDSAPKTSGGTKVDLKAIQEKNLMLDRMKSVKKGPLDYSFDSGKEKSIFEDFEDGPNEPEPKILGKAKKGPIDFGVDFEESGDLFGNLEQSGSGGQN